MAKRVCVCVCVTRANTCRRNEKKKKGRRKEHEFNYMAVRERRIKRGQIKVIIAFVSRIAAINGNFTVNLTRFYRDCNAGKRRARIFS